MSPQFKKVPLPYGYSKDSGCASSLTIHHLTFNETNAYTLHEVLESGPRKDLIVLVRPYLRIRLEGVI